MSLFVKICGLCRGEDVEAAAAAGPDAMGFVFWPESRRCVAPQDVADWTRDVPPGILKVGVFVDERPDRVARAAGTAGLDIVQLHGAETPENCRRAWRRAWKALHLRPDEPQAVTPYPVEALLIDTPGGPMPGGTGIASDWTRAAVFVQYCALPVILAGGLDPANVARAVAQVGPWGVDVSSGVEAEPGRKDHAKIREFVSICRSL